ncbi:MAG: peptidase M48 [Rickettsiales bacterium]|nr:peptidase M48 [Rickettsiales bacterium]|tara:strand:- start:5780 stop:7015 length:1236 start_codon:yes stop_codon:yes gene_type:complete
MNVFLILILGFYISFYLFDSIVEWLNIRCVSTTIPAEFQGVYDDEKYAKSQRYLKETTRFGFIQQTVTLIVVVPFILLGGFNQLDVFVRSLELSSLFSGVVYILILLLGMMFMGIPFSYYSTFVIEESYGFNKSTKSIFWMDFLKSMLLSFLIGIPILMAILWFFESLGSMAWVVAWGFLIFVQLILVYIAPSFIMPLFNTFEPLEDGELKTKLEAYSLEHNFSFEGIYKMDGSKRSSKSNAYFTGFGKQRRIVLFDTLIEKHSADELLAILAHEMGHYKLRHIHKSLALSVVTSGLMLFLLSLFLNNVLLAEAFGMESVSIYSSLIFFGFLFQPIEAVIGVLSNYLSRKHEFEADAFAVRTTALPDAMIGGLKRLSVDNLSNLEPSYLKVWVDYTHPPVLQRINAIRKLG